MKKFITLLLLFLSLNEGWKSKVVRRSARMTGTRLRKSQSDHLRSDSIEEVMKMKNSQLKEALRDLSVNTRGVFDKHELAKLYMDAIKTVEKSQMEQKTDSNDKRKLEVNILTIPSSNVPGAKDFIGLRLTDERGNLLTAMIDTAASTNLITSSAVQRLNLNRQSFNQYGSGLGGQAQLANEKTTLHALTFVGAPKIEIPRMEASILSRQGMIPANVDVLLGLPFLESLRSLIFLDLVNKKITFTPGTMHQGQKGKFHKIGMRRSYPTGLLMIDACIDGKGKVDAMIDLGSTYSILSKEAVQKVFEKKIETLPPSTVISAGISGAPMRMRECHLNSLLLGNTVEIKDHQVYAAEIPQLEVIGMGSGMFLLGIDVLGRHNSIAFCFKENALYLSK